MRFTRYGLASVGLAAALLLTPAQASAEACDVAGKGRTIVHYPIGSVATSATDQERLRVFADVARYRDHVCVIGKADAQGARAANEHLARARAESVAGLLVRYGVPREKIEVKTQGKGVTLWGMLDPDQPNDRRVTVTHN